MSQKFSCLGQWEPFFFAVWKYFYSQNIVSQGDFRYFGTEIFFYSKTSYVPKDMFFFECRKTIHLRINKTYFYQWLLQSLSYKPVNGAVNTPVINRRRIENKTRYDILEFQNIVCHIGYNFYSKMSYIGSKNSISSSHYEVFNKQR